MTEPLLIDARWDIPFKHAAGPHAARFFEGLRDQRILGVRCPACRRVLVPPRGHCEDCFVDTAEWVEVADVGTVATATIQYEAFPGLPEPPYAVGLVRLDGADTALLAALGGVPLGDADAALRRIGVGCRVRAVWRERREGRITDLAHFAPAEG
jgi:hypothetical protein